MHVETDVEDQLDNLTGPWIYKNMRNTWIHYVVKEDGKERTEKMLLQSLMKRGFSYKEKKPQTVVTPAK